MGAQGPDRPPRVVLDTNVVVSALVFRAGALAWLREAWLAGAVVPLVSRATLEELLRVLSYPKFRLAHPDVEELLALYIPFAQIVPQAVPRSAAPECPDADDQKFLDLAYFGSADYLVTGDRALLDMASVVAVPVVTPAEFLASMASQCGGEHGPVGQDERGQLEARLVPASPRHPPRKPSSSKRRLEPKAKRR
jgi:uncharacterized protein